MGGAVGCVSVCVCVCLDVFGCVRGGRVSVSISDSVLCCGFKQNKYSVIPS